MWQVMEVFWQLNQNTNVDYIDESRARLMFAMLDCSSNGTIERDEFDRLCDVLAMHFEKLVRAAPFEERFPSLSRCKVCICFSMSKIHLWSQRKCHPMTA